RRVDDGGVDRLPGLGAAPPVRAGVAQGGEGAAQVHADDVVPFVRAHVHEHPVAQDARVVDEHVQITEVFDGGLDQSTGAVEAGAVVAVGDRLAAVRTDPVDDLSGRAGR